MISVLITCALLPTSAALGAVVASVGTIANLMTYAQYGNGDVVVRLSSQPATCPAGFWLAPTQPGFKNNVALLMAARAAGDTILIGGDDTAIWPGSSGSYCKADHVGTPW